MSPTLSAADVSGTMATTQAHRHTGTQASQRFPSLIVGLKSSEGNLHDWHNDPPCKAATHLSYATLGIPNPHVPTHPLDSHPHLP